MHNYKYEICDEAYYWSSAGRSFVVRSLDPCPENFDQIVVVWVNYQSWGGGGVVNYQLQFHQPQILFHMSSLKMKNIQMEDIQTYQLQMIDSWGGGEGKLPNTNCDYQTTK